MMSMVMSKQTREFPIKNALEHNIYYLYVLEACLPTWPANFQDVHGRMSRNIELKVEYDAE